MSHDFFIRRTLELAEKGRGKTGVNPMVGAVLVRDGVVIAEGFHAEFGKDHAERQLLQNFDQKMRSTDVLYVNLEPCCHVQKKTPPCAQFLIERGVKQVVFGMHDPNPEVSGKGIDVLNKNNVQTFGPILEKECKRLNRGFVSLMTNQRPWITLKKARLVAGNIANPDGSPLSITSAKQNTWSHRFLRAKHDAILVGIGTILSDDPSLTIRVAETEMSPPLWRIILDPSLQIPLGAKVVNAKLAHRTIIITAPDQDSQKRATLESRGAQVVPVDTQGKLFHWKDLFSALTKPRPNFFGISSILVEGGKRTWDAFSQAGIVDEEITLVGE